MSISADHPEPAVGHTLLADAFGTGDYEFAHGLLTELTDVSRSGKVATRQELNFILSVVRGISPRDEQTEALLAVQMAADPERHHGRRPTPEPRRHHSPTGQRVQHVRASWLVRSRAKSKP